MLLRIACLVVASLSWCPGVLAQDNSAIPQQPPDKTSADASKSANGKLSDAEQITRLRKSIDDSEKRITDLQQRIDDPAGEYAKAQDAFNALDTQLQAKKKEALEAKKNAQSAEQTSTLDKELEALQAQWQLAKERFDLAIQERRAAQDQISALQQRIEQDKAALNRLLAPPEQPKSNGGSTTAHPTDEQATAPSQPADAESDKSESQKEAAPAVTLPGLPAATTQESKPPESTAPDKTKPESKQLVQAKEAAAAKETEVQQAEQEVRSIEERIGSLQKTIESERTLLATARKKVENARETERTLSEQVQKLANDNAPREQIQQTWTQIGDARQRLRESQDDTRKRVDRIDELQDELAQLQSERISALEDVRDKREAADEAAKQVAKIENPFSPKNLLKWMAEHGPRIVGVILGAMLLLALVRFADRRLISLIADRGERGSELERENRARTLVSVFHNAANVFVTVGALLMIIAEFEISVAPLMGGAAVIGLAVAFGAQNLIRDFFTGFMILLENQYGVNDVVKIGDNAGLVERVTLRLTVLRDLEGVVHFIPNGQITTVRNMTHNWSRALFDIGVAYKENVDQVMEVLMGLARQMREDPQYRFKILDEPEMLGVDSFGDSAVVIKFMIKTRPLHQWAIKRELLRRIKNRFDELGIEIPFPHRTIYHRTENGASDFDRLLATPVAVGHDDH